MAKRSICWRCENAVPSLSGRGCEWSRFFVPVPGWTTDDTGAEDCPGELVVACPKFREEARRCARG